MATTSDGLPYPVGTDKVRDGDNAIAALAAAISSLRRWLVIGRVDAQVEGNGYLRLPSGVSFPDGRAPQVVLCVAIDARFYVTWDGSMDGAGVLCLPYGKNGSFTSRYDPGATVACYFAAFRTKGSAP